MDIIKNINRKEMLAAVERMRRRRNILARTEKAMRRKLQEARWELSEAGQLVLQADRRLRLLERAAVLRQDPPGGEQTRLRLRLSNCCETAARDDISAEFAKKLEQTIKLYQLELRVGCKHSVVFGYERHTYSAEQQETGGHLICAYCGLSEIVDSDDPKRLAPAEGRTFVWYCSKDNEPDNLD